MAMIADRRRPTTRLPLAGGCCRSHSAVAVTFTVGVGGGQPGSREGSMEKTGAGSLGTGLALLKTGIRLGWKDRRCTRG